VRDVVGLEGRVVDEVARDLLHEVVEFGCLGGLGGRLRAEGALGLAGGLGSEGLLGALCLLSGGSRVWSAACSHYPGRSGCWLVPLFDARAVL